MRTDEQQALTDKLANVMVMAAPTGFATSAMASAELAGYFGQDAFERARSYKRFIFGASAGLLTATGVAVLAASVVLPSVAAIGGTTAAVAALASFIGLLTAGGYWYGRGCDIA